MSTVMPLGALADFLLTPTPHDSLILPVTRFSHLISTEADRYKLLPDRVEQLGVHGLLVSALSAANLRSNPLDGALADNFSGGSHGHVHGPTDQQSEERAVRTAKTLAMNHVGVIASSRDAAPRWVITAS
jgi:hypothetical protein